MDRIFILVKEYMNHGLHHYIILDCDTDYKKIESSRLDLIYDDLKHGDVWFSEFPEYYEKSKLVRYKLLFDTEAIAFEYDKSIRIQYRIIEHVKNSN